MKGAKINEKSTVKGPNTNKKPKMVPFCTFLGMSNISTCRLGDILAKHVDMRLVEKLYDFCTVNPRTPMEPNSQYKTKLCMLNHVLSNLSAVGKMDKMDKIISELQKHPSVTVLEREEVCPYDSMKEMNLLPRDSFLDLLKRRTRGLYAEKLVSLCEIPIDPDVDWNELRKRKCMLYHVRQIFSKSVLEGFYSDQ